MRRLHWVLLLIASLLIAATMTLIFGQALIPVSNMETDHRLKQQPESENSSAVTVEASKYPMKLTMAIDRTELDLGETLCVNLTVENIGDQDLTMSFADGQDEFIFAVYNESDSQCVYTHWVGYPQCYIPEVVHVNETRTKDWEWNQVGDLVYLGLDQNPPYYRKTITPGEYHIIGLFESSTLNLQIETPPISFTIHG